MVIAVIEGIEEGDVRASDDLVAEHAYEDDEDDDKDDVLEPFSDVVSHKDRPSIAYGQSERPSRRRKGTRFPPGEDEPP
jgi:hypothetical protein